MRLLCWFSCGVTSAVAIKMALNTYRNMPALIVYCDTGSEHVDNKRFLADCEKWFEHKIEVVKSKKYQDIYDVFTKTRYLVGPKGARCTTELKKVLRHNIEDLETDLQIFGFDATEKERVAKFRQNNPEVRLITPLLDNNISKARCLEILTEANIAVPMMYKLGYKNNNCVGCVKGQAGYWNKIRRDFPETFDKMAKVERELNAAICKTYKNGKRQRVFLDELPIDMGRYKPEKEIKCGLICGE